MKGVIDPIRVEVVTVEQTKRAWWSLWLYKRPVKKSAWRLLESVDYKGILAPAGFIFDFASIPKPVRVWISPTDAGIRRSALFHDLLYSKKGLIVPSLPPSKMIELFKDLWEDGDLKILEDGRVQFSRRGSDRVFREIMGFRKYGPLKRAAAYHGVRLGGWIHWQKESDK